MKTVLARLQERSTWAGIGMLLPVLGIQLSPATWDATILAVQGVLGLVLVVLKEPNRP